MIVLNGMTSFITMPAWMFMLLIEIATVVVEVFVIYAIWWLRDGKLSKWWIILSVSVANAITAAMGIVVYESYKNELYNGNYYFYTDTTSPILAFVLATLFVLSVALVILAKNNPNEKTAEQDTT